MVATAAREGAHARSGDEPGTLFLCATPIGNLADVTFRVIDTLRSADVIMAEDTRHTRKLLTHYGITTRPVSLHAHNEKARLPQVVSWLRAGQTVALVADAGTPGISDPGYLLVRETIAAGLPVTVLPGPTALIPALILSGLPATPFVFLGFPPRRAGQRRRLFDSLKDSEWTVVLYESPHRLRRTLQDLTDALGADRPAAVARELTKHFEEVTRGPLGQLCDRYDREVPRGEMVIIIGGKV